MSSQTGLHLSINSFEVQGPCMSEELSPMPNTSSKLQTALLSSVKINTDSQVTQSSISSSSYLKAISLIFQLDKLKIRMMNKAFKTIEMTKLNSPIILFPFLNAESNKKQIGSTKTSLGELSTLSQASDSCQKYSQSQTNKVSIQFEQRSQKHSLKFLQKEIFMQKITISQKSSEIKALQQELAQSQRRQLKQERKKKQSLLSLAEQLAQKSECIQQLKSIIRGLESKLNIPQAQLMVLEEDSETLRRTVERLEGVNDKLNHDLEKIRDLFSVSSTKNKQLLEQNHLLKNEIKHLKEELFQIELEKKQNFFKSQQIKAWERNIVLRQKRMKLNEQKYEKSQSYILQSFSNLKQQEVSMLQEKIDKILSFIFHIDNPNYFLLPAGMFQKEQIQVLEFHKKRMSLLEQSSSNHFRQSYSPSQERYDDISCLSMLNHAQEQSIKIQQDTIRLRLQNEKNRLIQKITELKKKDLHGRSVVLQFIKSISQKITKENMEILQQLLEFFQYSQSQKKTLILAKPKKILGFF